jgi:hypothetical protein
MVETQDFASLRKQKGETMDQTNEEKNEFEQAAKTAAQPKTAGAKDVAAGAASALERAAKKAMQNAHSRASVQEYMRARRKF